MVLGLLLAASLGPWAQTLPASKGLVADATELRVLQQSQTNWLTGTTLADAAIWKRGVLMAVSIGPSP